MELTGLQDRTFTHTEELAHHRHRLKDLTAELENGCPQTCANDNNHSEAFAASDAH
ncbi:MAG: hypothetical protein FWD61_15765 [Phycisphaerales bacterium]|nr:hypothetical protein [Phycisphaerales bacterium]